MNKEILRELVSYDIANYNDIEVMSEVAATITTGVSSNGTNIAPIEVAEALQAVLTSENLINLTVKVEAYYKKDDTLPITKLNDGGTQYEGTIYIDKPFWYKITITNANENGTDPLDEKGIARRVELTVPQPTNITFAYDGSDERIDISYGIGNTTNPTTGGSDTIVMDNVTHTITIGGAERADAGTPSLDDIPAKTGTDNGCFVAWIKATATA